MSFDMAAFRRRVASIHQEDDMTPDEAKVAFKEALTEFFRDEDGGLPDIGRARIKMRDGRVVTLADVAGKVYEA